MTGAVRPAAAPTMEHLDKLNRLTESHGALQPGKGMVSGVIALALAILCFLGVLAFHFPEYLTTPQLRKSYSVDAMRLAAVLVDGAGRRARAVQRRPQPARWLAFAAFALIGLSLALGGHKVPVNDFADDTPYIGLDWFILDLLGSTLIFVFHREAVRAAQGPAGVPARMADRLRIISSSTIWSSGSILLATNLLVHKLFGWAAQGRHPRLGAGPELLRRRCS